MCAAWTNICESMCVVMRGKEVVVVVVKDLREILDDLLWRDR